MIQIITMYMMLAAQATQPVGLIVDNTLVLIRAAYQCGKIDGSIEFLRANEDQHIATGPNFVIKMLLDTRKKVKCDLIDEVRNIEVAQ